MNDRRTATTGQSLDPSGDAQEGGWRADTDTDTDTDGGPPNSPAVRLGAPLSEALRQQLAQAVTDGTAWMNEHRMAVRWAAIAAAAGGLAFLLHTGQVPGWRQYTHLSELPPRLLASNAPRLPVVLLSVAQHGEVLAVQAAHYPLLRRLGDSYRRLPPSMAAHRAKDRGQLLTCYLTGPVQPNAAGLRHLRQLELAAVHRLRLLSIIDASDQSWTAAGGAAHGLAGAAVGRLQLGMGGEAGATRQSTLAPQPAPLQAQPHLPAPEAAGWGQQEWQQGQQQYGEGQAAAATADWPEPAPGQELRGTPMLWGELYAREPRRGLAALLPGAWRRQDVAEQLIRRGEAAMLEPIDLEWLGASWHRIDRLYAAEQAAIRAGVGIWAVRRPTVHEWSRDVARSAWLRVQGAGSRVRHAARSTAAATADSVGSAAAAASTAVAKTLAAPKPLANSAAARARGAWGQAVALARRAAAAVPARKQAAPAGPDGTKNSSAGTGSGPVPGNSVVGAPEKHARSQR